MPGRLTNEHVLVTGASKGIGAAIVEKCLEEEGRVSFIDVDEAGGKALVRNLNTGEGRLVFGVGDVRSAADIARVYGEAIATLGPVTGLVNNAGRNSYADPVSMTELEWEDVFAVDLKAAWLCCRAVLPGMLGAERGSIVNIASLH